MAITNSNSKEFQDGHLYQVLKFIEKTPLVTKDRIKTWFTNEFGEDNLFDSILAHLGDNNLITIKGNCSYICLPGALEWLSNRSELAGVESEGEENGSDAESKDETNIREPYEVTKLKMEPKLLSIFQVLRKIEKGEIDLNPEFQRAFVWDATKQSRLIESILIRIPLPAFYLDATDQVKWSVVDGLQRLTTLYSYCRKQEFTLSNLEFLPELDGMKFDNLPSKYKVVIEDDTMIQLYNLMPGTPINAKFTIFSRVNTGGLQLTPQEIRHALNQGKITRLLAKVTTTDIFQKVTCGSVESKRMTDRELALRAMVFGELGFSLYREFGDFNNFLMHGMYEFNSYSDSNLKSIEEGFYSSLEKVWTVFGAYSFRKFYSRYGRRGPLNKALFEVWVSSVKKYSLESLASSKDEIIDGFIKLVTYDDSFIKSISSSTSSNFAVTKRFYKISKLLKEIVERNET